jgi:integrase
MPRKRLTQKIVNRLKSEPVQREHWTMDADIPALGLRRRPRRQPQYGLRWVSATGQQHKIRLASAAVSLDIARKLAQQRLGELAHGFDPLEFRKAVRASLSVSEAIEGVLIQLHAEARSERHVTDTQRYLERHVAPRIGHVPLREVTAADIDHLLRQLSGTPHVQSHTRSALSRLFRLSQRWGDCAHNPVEGAVRPKLNPRQRLISTSELERLWIAMSEHPHANGLDVALKLMMVTGARPQEICHSKWQDFDCERGVWTRPARITKQRRDHVVDLHPSVPVLLETLHARLGQAHPVWIFRDRQPTAQAPYRSLHSYWTKLCTLAKVTGAVPYDLRKLFVTQLMSNGTDLKTIMSLSGHATASVLINHYAQLVPGSQRRALARLCFPTSK